MIRPSPSFFCRTKLCVRVLFCSALAAVATPVLTANSPRSVIELDENWRVHLGEAPEAVDTSFDDSRWRQVNVPHDYVVEGTFIEKDPEPRAGSSGRQDWFWYHAFLPTKPAVYRKTFTLPAGTVGKRLWLEFDGVFSNSFYWVNGKLVGSEYSGYTRSRFDITAAAKPAGENIITVQVDPRYDGWWYEGGGIYRHVRLVAVDPIHIAPNGVFVAPTVADPGDGMKANATIQIITDVANTGSSHATAKVVSEILDNDGKTITSTTSQMEIATDAVVKSIQSIPLTEARLWSTDHPYLYRLRSTIRVSGKVVDAVTTNFGVLQARFDPDRGFFLNGKRLKIHGVNMHQDHAGVGVAMPDRLFTWRLERLKEVGCNAIRLSHNPVTPFLLDECDRLGFLVIAENRHLGDTYDDQTRKDAHAVEHRHLSSLVTCDRNHASIILWSLCNEQWIQGSPEAAAMIRAMTQRVHELDPTRPVTAAMNGGFTDKDGMIGLLDVIGTNYHPDVYATVHAQNPTSPMVATEIASEVATRGVYASERWETYTGDRGRGYVSAYSINTAGAQVVEDAWPAIAENDFMAGGFVWAGFDYKGEPRPFQWPVINSHYGFMDICGFPKDSYYYYKAWWTNEPVLHLFPHWNWPGKEGQEISVWVHSNCDEVELFLNGASVGKQTVTPLHHLEWKVKYAPGKLVAKGTHHGIAMETSRETTGAPAAIHLTADRSTIAADNADLAVVTVEIVDAAGRVVPVADNKVTFALTGPAKLIGVGNGDPGSHEPDKASSRSVFNGLAQALVQSTREAGAIKLTASGDGLESATALLSSQPSPLP